MKAHRTTVNDLMTTGLLTLRERDTVEQADFDMRLAQVRHIPVLDQRGHLVGILSNRDLMRALAAGRGQVAVATVMTRQVHTVRPWTPAHQAAGILLEKKIGALPVLGEDGALVGIVTETDFLRVARRALGGSDESSAEADWQHG